MPVLDEIALRPYIEPMAGWQAAVLLDRVSFSYQKLCAVDRLSLEVPPGISLGLLGPNGAGKTTLIKLIAGLLNPQAGEIRLLGQPPSRQRAAGSISSWRSRWR